MNPAALDHCTVGHCSTEPGHRKLLERLDKRPLLDLDMRLGEGSGAMAAVPLIAMACAGVTKVPTLRRVVRLTRRALLLVSDTRSNALASRRANSHPGCPGHPRFLDGNRRHRAGRVRRHGRPRARHLQRADRTTSAKVRTVSSSSSPVTSPGSARRCARSNGSGCSRCSRASSRPSRAVIGARTPPRRTSRSACRRCSSDSSIGAIWVAYGACSTDRRHLDRDDARHRA